MLVISVVVDFCIVGLVCMDIDMVE
jgi:hypothetical protein